MTKLIIVRHGEPDYSYVTKRGFKGQGRDLAQLTPEGIEQAKVAAKDVRLDGAEFIISSPYTRALQTAAIISRERDLEIKIELDIHEWLPDINFNYTSEEFAMLASKECTSCKGKYEEHEKKSWEMLSSVADRSINCMKKYLNYEKIIVVAHGIVMKQFKYQDYIPYCGIIELDFDENFKWAGWTER